MVRRLPERDTRYRRRYLGESVGATVDGVLKRSAPPSGKINGSMDTKKILKKPAQNEYFVKLLSCVNDNGCFHRQNV